MVSFFLFFFGYSSNAQDVADYTIYYDFKSISDTIENTFLRSEEFILYRVGQESRFLASARYYNDSMGAVFLKDYPQPAFNSQEEVQNYVNLIAKYRDRKTIQSNYRVNKNFQSGNFIALLLFSLPTQYMEEPMNFKWNISNEVDTILGLPSIKASTNYGGRHYYAWFTSAIPINDGPYVFQGLPGLILKVADERGWYTFSAKHIIADKTIRYWKPDFINKFSKKIDRKAFVDKMIEYKQNPQMPPGVINFTEEDRLKMKDAHKNRFDLLIEQY